MSYLTGVVTALVLGDELIACTENKQYTSPDDVQITEDNKCRSRASNGRWFVKQLNVQPRQTQLTNTYSEAFNIVF